MNVQRSGLKGRKLHVVTNLCRNPFKASHTFCSILSFSARTSSLLYFNRFSEGAQSTQLEFAFSENKAPTQMCSEQHVCGEHVSETLAQEAFQRGADERLHVLVNAVQK